MCTTGYGYMPTITQRSASALAMQAVHQEESFPTWGILAMCVDAVAQKSPCEEIRVIMGKESPLKLSQRGPDAREEVPMRTPKRLYAEARIIYQPELLTCLHCGDLLVPPRGHRNGDRSAVPVDK